MKNVLLRIILLLKFIAKGKSKFYIHSPFVYDFCTSVLSTRITDALRHKIESIKHQILSDHTSLNLIEMGAGNQSHHRTTVTQYFKKTAISNKYGYILTRIVEHYNVKQIIETGTGLGMSSCWMALASTNPHVQSIEGNIELIEYVRKLTSNMSITAIELHHGSVDDLLPTLVKDIREGTLLFLDANHTAAATLRYFNIIIPFVKDDTIIVFDDINYSADMQMAWHTIIKHQRVTLSVNLYRMGVIFFRPELSKQEFYLYH